MELDYKPSEDFVVNNVPPLDKLNLTESQELWLIQCPLTQFPEIDGKVLKVKLDKDGKLGGSKDSSSNIDLVSYASQEADAVVIMPSGEDSKIVGKISRRVTLVRFPEPKELLETVKVKTQQKLMGGLTDSAGKYSNLAQSSKRKTGQSGLTRSSKQKSMFTGFTETPEPKNRKQSESSAGKHRSSTTTDSGVSDRSGKSKKKVKFEK